jgi:hypothetical protein
MESLGIQVDKVKVVPYKKSYSALIADKAQYFNVKPRNLYQKIREATEGEKNLYSIKKKQMTLFYTLIKGIKQN